MALIGTYGDSNKQIHELETTVKTSTIVVMYTVIGGNETDGWIFGNAPFSLIETITRESFSYVGMTSAAAAACAAAMIAAYTKNISKPVVNMGTGAITYSNEQLIVASVRPVHVGGGMYQVDVDRNEPEYSLVAMFTRSE